MRSRFFVLFLGLATAAFALSPLSSPASSSSNSNPTFVSTGERAGLLEAVGVDSTPGGVGGEHGGASGKVGDTRRTGEDGAGIEDDGV